MFTRKVLKNIKKMNDQRDLMLKTGVAAENDSGVKSYVCFIVKAFSESFAALAKSAN